VKCLLFRASESEFLFGQESSGKRILPRIRKRWRDRGHRSAKDICGFAPGQAITLSLKTPMRQRTTTRAGSSDDLHEWTEEVLDTYDAEGRALLVDNNTQTGRRSTESSQHGRRLIIRFHSESAADVIADCR
jgi:hypothetical protein